MSSIDLAQIFQSVTSVLADNKDDLNKADTYNNDHGDHMVDIFNFITEAVGKKSDENVSEQLSYAGKQLLKTQKSGSAELYGNGLLEAANQFTDSSLDVNSVIGLVQTLLSGGKAAPAPAKEESGVKGLLGGLFKEVDLGDVLNAGMAFMKAKQEGDSNLQAALEAVVTATTAGQTPHRAQSGMLVANAILDALT